MDLKHGLEAWLCLHGLDLLGLELLGLGHLGLGLLLLSSPQLLLYVLHS